MFTLLGKRGGTGYLEVPSSQMQSPSPEMTELGYTCIRTVSVEPNGHPRRES